MSDVCVSIENILRRINKQFQIGDTLSQKEQATVIEWFLERKQRWGNKMGQFEVFEIGTGRDNAPKWASKKKERANKISLSPTLH